MELIAFHGTDIDAKRNILTTQHFYMSEKDNEWAGSGIYFFIDQDVSVAKEHAKKWSKKQKKNSEDRIAIVEVDIVYTSDDLLDLTSEEHCEIFQIFRRTVFENAVERAQRNNKDLEQLYLSESKLECFTINKICKICNKHLVKKAVYMKCLEEEYYGYIIPKSFVTNCVIMAVRDQSFIKNIR